MLFFFFFQAEDGIRDVERSRGLGDVYKRQWFNIPLTFPCSKKNIASAAFFYHSFCNRMMFVFISVFFKFRPIVIPVKVCPNLISYISKICVDRKVIFAGCVFDWAYPF
eukprot:TRINITY_DN12205_c0_g1_i1.p5 TRINITY_DN12205_c0_g1~~TRINITY_DN12205_c0_g1_i1.p5  ORF type:complete len:109 (-),score=19.02 TRINITY_DN12205_c0_g1_i1:562-888(-)